MKIRFLEFKSLEETAPVSGIEVFEEQFFFVGHNSRELVLGDKDWRLSDTVILDSHATAQAEGNTVKNEATLILKDNKQPVLFILKSGKGDNNSGFLMNLKTRAVEKIDLSVFYNRLRLSGLPNLDIESAAVVNDKIVLCNRGAAGIEGESRLIFTSLDFWKKQATADFFKAKIEWEQLPGMNVKVSAITYSYENDWLILAATAERKQGEGESGPALDCYIGVVENGYRKSDRKRIKVNELIELSEVDAVFRNQTIDSLAIQADKKDKIKLHLVSTDTNGANYLLKLRLKG